MKFATHFFIVLLFCSGSSDLFAGDVYAEYKITGLGNKTTISKMYIKDGDMRSEVKMDVAGREMVSTTLNLKSNPDFSIVYNSFSKTYTEVKKKSDNTKQKNYSITDLGNEKVGEYNCKHVRMKSDTTSWDMWITKDLPFFNFPIEKNDEAANKKIMELLKSKSAEGFMVKMAFLRPGSTNAGMTMELQKYEGKTLDPSLFKVPEGYTKSANRLDSEKMKSMSPEERREMIKKMMEENMPQK